MNGKGEVGHKRTRNETWKIHKEIQIKKIISQRIQYRKTIKGNIKKRKKRPRKYQM